MDNNVLPWEKPRIKRLMEIFGNCRVYNVKKINNITKVVKNNEEEICR